MKKLTVVIPAFRCAQTLSQVLDSLLVQSAPPHRIIVVNDQSPDHLDEVLSPYHDKIEVITNPENYGLAKSYNQGLRLVDTEYVMTLHSDCILEKDYIRKLIQVLERDESIAVATGQYRFPDVRKMGFTDRLYLALNLIPYKDNESDDELRAVSFIEGKADVFRTEYLRELNYFNESYILTGEDQDLSARIRKHGWKIAQLLSCRFKSAFGGTQDSVKKVINKQRTYARGQALIALRHGYRTFGKTTQNRNVRSVHRALQLLSTALLLALVPIALFLPAGIWILISLILVRYISYLFICSGFGPMNTLIISAFGFPADLYYTWGFAEGMIKGILFRKV